jgi:hypothetical protein
MDSDEHTCLIHKVAIIRRGKKILREVNLALRSHSTCLEVQNRREL